MLLIYLGLIDAVRSCAKTQQVVTELHATKYVCTRTETTMTRCVFTECTYDTPGGQGSIISILPHWSLPHYPTDHTLHRTNKVMNFHSMHLPLNCGKPSLWSNWNGIIDPVKVNVEIRKRRHVWYNRLMVKYLEMLAVLNMLLNVFPIQLKNRFWLI